MEEELHVPERVLLLQLKILLDLMKYLFLEFSNALKNIKTSNHFSLVVLEKLVPLKGMGYEFFLSADMKFLNLSLGVTPFQENTFVLFACVPVRFYLHEKVYGNMVQTD